MQVTINDNHYEVPFDPALITLDEFLTYQREYGNALDKELHEIRLQKYVGDDLEIEQIRNAAIEDHIDKRALSWYSYWTKFDLDAVKEMPGIIPLLNQYRVLSSLLLGSSEAFPAEVYWNEDTWAIQDFKVNATNEMSFNEVITSKEVMRQMQAIKAGRYDALPYLCAVFFRKKGEAFTDALIREEGERMQLFKSLPLSHALKVAFFLNSFANTWKRISAYSQIEELATLSLN